MSGPGTGSGIPTSDFEELQRAELMKALAEPDQTVEEKEYIATQHKDLNEPQGALREKELQEDSLKGHWEDELDGYLTDKSSKSKKRATPPPSPGATYKAWKAKARRRHRRYRYSNNNPYSILDCPWPFCSGSFPNEDAVFDHYRAHHPLYIDNPGSKKPLQCPFCLGLRYGPKSSRLMRGHQNRQHRSNRWARTGEGAGRDAQEALAGQASVSVEREEFPSCDLGMGLGVEVKLEDGLGFE